MPEFEKQFVHFMWDSALEGKMVFFADYVSTLKERVETGEIKFYEKVIKGSEPMPFRMADTQVCCQLIYFDPHYALKLAHEQGYKIQVLAKGNGKWLDISNPCWDVEPEAYRVKPEPEPEPEPEEKPITNRELAQWLAEGYGQYMDVQYSIARALYCYAASDDDIPVHKDTRVRLWGDTEWHVPTQKYMYSEE